MIINFATDPVEKKRILQITAAAALKIFRVLKNPRSRDIVGLYFFFSLLKAIYMIVHEALGIEVLLLHLTLYSRTK